MTPWQILRAGKVSRAALGFHVYHEPGVTVHYSTATGASAAPHGSRSFSLSREKLTMQQLNRRLASYLKQVQCLEATNRMLECQIRNVLERTFPEELSELDTHLEAAALLQDQISEGLSARALMRLQLANAELHVFNLSARRDAERERRERLEQELSNLRRQGEELRVRELPELQALLSRRTQQLVEQRMRHRQTRQHLLDQASGEAVQTETETGSSDLILQLGDPRRASATLIKKNRGQRWGDSQTSVPRSPEASFDSEVVQVGINDLRRTAAGLQQELHVLQSLTGLLKTSGVERTEALVLRLGDLHQRAEALRRELDSEEQAAARQAADHRMLLNITTQLEAEMKEYGNLLDERRQQSEKEAKQARKLGAKGGNQRVMEFHKGCVCVPPKVFGALPKTTGSNFMAMTHAMINKQNSSPEDDVHTEDGDRLKSTGAAQICQDYDKVGVDQASKTDAKGIAAVLRGQLSARNVELQAQPTTSIESKKAIIVEAKATGTQGETEIPKAKPRGQAELKQAPHSSTKTTSGDDEQAAAVLKPDKESGMPAHTSSSRGSVQEKAQSKTADVVDAQESTSGDHLYRSRCQVQGSAQLTLVNKGVMGETASGEGKSLVFELDQHSLDEHDMINGKQDKVTKGEDTKSIPAYMHQDSDGNLGDTIASTEISKKGLILNKEKVDRRFHDTEEVMVDQPFINEAVLSATESKQTLSLSDSGVALGLSDSELSPFLSPTSPEKGLGSPQTLMSMSSADQVFFPLELEEHFMDPDVRLKPNDPDMYRNSGKCSSPVTTNWSLKQKGKDDKKETCLHEGKAHVRERYILSARVGGQSLSFGAENHLPERDKNKRVTISVRDGDSLCFGSFEGQGMGESDVGGIGCGTSGGCNVAETKEEKVGYDNLKDGKADRVACSDPQSLVSRLLLETKKEASPPVVPSSGDTVDGRSSLTDDRGASFSSTSTASSGPVGGDAPPAVTDGTQGQLRQRCREWMVYGRSLGQKSSWELGSSSNKWTNESPSTATQTATSQGDMGRFRRQGGGNEEWMVNRGRCGSEGSLNGSIGSGKQEKGRSLSLAMDPVISRFNRREPREWTAGKPIGSHLATSPPETRRFVHPGSAEWLDCNTSNILPNVGSPERLPTMTTLATSPPRMGRFGIRGGGEWRVYGLHDGHMSIMAGCDERQPADREIGTSPPAAGRFGSGEWRVYGGSTGGWSGTGGGKSMNQSISPPSSYTCRRQGLSSDGSGGAPTSGGVGGRSRSVDSSGGLRISGSGGKISSGNFTGNSGDAQKPICSPAGRRRSRVVIGPASGRPMSGGKTSPSPSRRTNPSGAGSRRTGGCPDNTGSSRHRFQTQAHAGLISTSPPARTNRVIASSDRPGNKAGVSVCKMAASKISAAGRERSWR